MKLSEKLQQLKKEILNDEINSQAIDDAFNRCIEHSEMLEEHIESSK